MAAENVTAAAPEELEGLAAEAAALEGETIVNGAAAPEPKQAGPSTAELLLPVVGLMCGLFCPAWNIQQVEQQALAEAYGAVVDKYFPDGINFGVELNALLITAAIIGPRLKMPRTVVNEGAESGGG